VRTDSHGYASHTFRVRPYAARRFRETATLSIEDASGRVLAFTRLAIQSPGLHAQAHGHSNADARGHQHPLPPTPTSTAPARRRPPGCPQSTRIRSSQPSAWPPWPSAYHGQRPDPAILAILHRRCYWQLQLLCVHRPGCVVHS
jgi:hypothetical protein